ncbi:Def8 protein [Aphelenchoides avenae]|nr:Def8 protein [Aphelenchus avenae]
MSEDKPSGASPPDTSKLETAELTSDYQSFVDSQIKRVIEQERQRNRHLDRSDELALAIEFCKKYLVDPTTSDNDKRAEVLSKLVELKLELEQHKEATEAGESIDKLLKHTGHDLVLQSAGGRNPYCERAAFRVHDKCVPDIRRVCAAAKVAHPSFKLNLRICPEISLKEQDYRCAECQHPIGFDGGVNLEPRLCDYTGRYYCRRCHWNDYLVVPARMVRNWDAEKRTVCRASKQLLLYVEKKAIINIAEENPALFKYVNSLNRMQKLRKNILLMKCYFSARKLRILQYLSRYQHFVESSDLYSLDDLEIEQIVSVFTTHITKDCAICMGNAFVCELCTDKNVFLPCFR